MSVSVRDGDSFPTLALASLELFMLYEAHVPLEFASLVSC